MSIWFCVLSCFEDSISLCWWKRIIQHLEGHAVHRKQISLWVCLWFFQQWSVKAAVSEWFLSGVCVIEILVLSENDSSLRGINSARNNLRFIAVWCRSRLGVCLGFFCTSSVHCWASDSKGIDLCYPAVWHWHLLFDDRDQPGDHGTL